MKFQVRDEFGTYVAGPFPTRAAAVEWIVARRAAVEENGGLPLDGTSHQGDKLSVVKR